MRIRALVMPILGVACVFFAACGGGKSHGSAPSTGSATAAKTASVEAFKAAAERAANSTLLTIVDFSKGWEGTAQHHSDLELQLSPGCQAWSDKPTNYDGAVFENEVQLALGDWCLVGDAGERLRHIVLGVNENRVELVRFDGPVPLAVNVQPRRASARLENGYRRVHDLFSDRRHDAERPRTSSPAFARVPALPPFGPAASPG